MKNIAKFGLYTATVLTAVVSLPSCSIDDLNPKGSKGAIQITVDTNKDVETKSGSTEIYETVDLSEEGLPFFLSATKTPYKEDVFGQSAATRGEIITTDNIAQSRGEFALNVLEGTSKYAAVDGTYDNTAKYGENTKIIGNPKGWLLEHEVDWQDSDPNLDFWAYSYPASADGEFTRGDDFKSFTYNGPASAGQRNDGTLLADLLVAHTGTQTQNDVKIKFYHALAAVRFNLSDSFAEEVNYLSVSVSGVKRKGSAVYNGTYDDEVALEGRYTWTPDDEVVTYEQVLYDNTTDAISVDDRTMFIIPQDITNVRFTFHIINYSQTKEYVLTTKTLGTTKWTAGYLYNYTIGSDLSGNVEIKVLEDEFDGEKKENVKVGVTKSSAVYIRAYVVANWCTKGANSKVYAPYTGGIQYNTDDWILGKDGYYYCKKPVLGYSESDNLIDQFTLTGSAPVSPYTLHLEMNILAQAVTYDVKDNASYTFDWAWGSPKDTEGNSIYSQLEKL